MIVSDDPRFLFIHVQKTGGNSITRWLFASVPDAARGGGHSKHATLAAALEMDPTLVDAFTFGFVRNPWARMVSWHQMILRRALAVPERVRDNRLWHGVSSRYQDFDAFVLEATAEYEELSRPQVDYLRTPTREADLVGRTESLQADFDVVLDRLGLAAASPLGQANAGPARDYRTLYGDRTRAHVARLFAADLEAYGYEF